MNARIIFAGALALGFALPSIAGAQAPAPNASATPYPAYGSPAPDISVLRPVPGVPAQITLGQAIAIAVAKSPVLAAARGNYELTRIPVQLAQTAIYPNISGVASTTRSNSSVARSTTGGSTTGGSIGESFTSNGLNVELRQLIYDGGKVMAQLRSARASEVAGLQTYQRQEQTLAFNVAQAYYTALQARAATLLAAQVVNQNVVQENLIRAQLRAGTAARVDVATAELPTAQARVALVRAQGQELSALAAFANTLGLSSDTDVHPVDDTSGVSEAVLLARPPAYDVSLQRALALRPDYLASLNAIEAARQNVRAQRLNLFPTLSGTASAGTNSTLPNGTAFRPSDSIGASLTIPIFDQGITHAQVAQAQAQLDIAIAQSQNARLGVDVNVRQALVNLVSAEAALQQSDAELSKARQVLQATQAQYRAGVTTLPLLLNAQVGLTQAQSDRLTALYGLRQAQQAYDYAVGQNDLVTLPTR